MGLGQSITVNLDKYLDVLGMFVNLQEVHDLKKVLSDYDIKGNVAVYSGPSDSD